LLMAFMREGVEFPAPYTARKIPTQQQSVAA